MKTRTTVGEQALLKVDSGTEPQLLSRVENALIVALRELQHVYPIFATLSENVIFGLQIGTVGEKEAVVEVPAVMEVTLAKLVEMVRILEGKCDSIIENCRRVFATRKGEGRQ